MNSYMLHCCVFCTLERDTQKHFSSSYLQRGTNRRPTQTGEMHHYSFVCTKFYFTIPYECLTSTNFHPSYRHWIYPRYIVQVCAPTAYTSNTLLGQLSTLCHSAVIFQTFLTALIIIGRFSSSANSLSSSLLSFLSSFWHSTAVCAIFLVHCGSVPSFAAMLIFVHTVSLG